MKTKYFTLIAAIGAIIAASCQKEIEQSQANDNDAISAGAKDFIALFDGVNVKATLDQNRKQIWSEGDSIGVTTAEDANLKCVIKSVSAGTFDGEAIKGGAPYYAVYPYSADNTFSGDVLTAILPAEQVVGQGEKMAKGVMVAACKSESNTLEFNNCVALFQLTIPCDTIKKVEIAATKEGQYLAGKFTMDLAASPLAPAVVTDDSANEPSQSVTLKAENDDNLAAGTYYMAVLPGTLDTLQISFFSAADTVTVKRTNVSLTRSTGINLGNFFVYDIGTADELITWAQQSAKFTKWDVVNITNNIALTEAQADSYVEANDFKGEFKGNGKTISGLKTPLFGDLRGAYVHDITVEANVTLTAPQTARDVTAKLKGQSYGSGLLAHYAYNKEKLNTPKIKNVTTKGSLTIDFTGGNVTHNYLVGGIVGGDNNVPLENCKNEAAVTIENIELTTGVLLVGGVCGANQDGAKATLTDCTNHGDIQVSEGAKVASECSVAGISGKGTQPTPIVRCKNFGAVTNGAGQASKFCTAGICGWVTGNLKFEDCTNSEAILDNSAYATAKTHYVAGIVGFAPNSMEVSECINSGTVTNSAANTSHSYTAGICGRAEGNNTKFIKCQNSEEALILDGATSTEDTNNHHPVAGIVAYATNTMEVEECINSGTVKNSASMASVFYTAGILGYSDKKVKISQSDNSGAILDNSECNTAKSHYVAGIVSYAAKDVEIVGCNNKKTENQNSGTVTNSATNAKISAVAGICGRVEGETTLKFTNCTNSGAILDESSNSTGEDYHSVAGIVCWAAKPIEVVECSNSGTVTNSASTASAFYTVGICGRADGSTVKFDGCTNSGAIQDNSAYATAKTHYVAGIVGYANGQTATASEIYINISDCHNTANITSEVKTVSSLKVGGICAYINNQSNITGCVNGTETSNEIIIKANKPTGANAATDCCYVAGILAHGNKASRVSDCINYATILNKCAALNPTDNSKSYLRLGGIVGNSRNETDKVSANSLYDKCKNYGNVMDESNGIKEGRCGGIVGSSATYKATIQNCYNEGDITSSSSSNTVCLGGIAGYMGNNDGNSIIDCVSNATVCQTGRTGESSGFCGEIIGQCETKNTEVEKQFNLKDNKLAGTVNGTAVTDSNCGDEGVLYGKIVDAGTSKSGNTLYTTE